MVRRPPRPAHRATRLIAVVMIALAVTGCGPEGGGGPGAERVAATEDADYLYVIPDGTGRRLDAGEIVDLVPARLDAEVGEVIRIENDDERSHTIGPFFVAAHQVLTQRFSTPGTYVGACYVHPSGQFELVVADVS